MVRSGSFHMVLRSHVKKQSKIIEALPDEIIFNILLLFPAHILYGVMRFVCRQWNRIINDPVFVTSFRPPTAIFLVQDARSLGHFLHLRECDIEIPNYKFQFPGDIIATCNGLTLVRDRRYNTTHRLCYIVNLATNRMMTLPRVPLDWYGACLAFAASSNTYKVLLVLYRRWSFGCIEFGTFQCAILTVNADKAWRFINCADINKMSIFMCRPVVNSGFVYWACGRFPCMLVLNVESESIKTISVPQMPLSNRIQTVFLPKGNTISYFYIDTDYTFKVWVLKDHESEDWVEFPGLEVEAIRRKVTNVLSPMHLDISSYVNYLQPISWLKNDEKILFNMAFVRNCLFIYDVKTGATLTFTVDIDARAIFQHLSNLT